MTLCSGEVGMTYRCSWCNSPNTYWSGLRGAWYCPECDETFDPLNSTEMQSEIEEQRVIDEWILNHPDEVAKLKWEHGIEG